jgi:hypothetical protein
MAGDTSGHQTELLSRIAAIATEAGGSVNSSNGSVVEGSVTAITSKWFLGGRKVINNFRCTLDPESSQVRYREAAVETSWGLPPPTLKVETTSQYGTRVKQTRTDTSLGGGGRLEFGKFREQIEQAARDVGWGFVYEVV